VTTDYHDGIITMAVKHSQEPLAAGKRMVGYSSNPAATSTDSPYIHPAGILPSFAVTTNSLVVTVPLAMILK
jgi:hypothetical protein